MKHYRCQDVVVKTTHNVRVSDTVDFRHPTIHTPYPTPEDRLQHGMEKLAGALTDSPPAAPNTDAQLDAL